MWIWLPGKTYPVVAARVRAQGDYYEFNYGSSYLAKEDAIPIYAPELPLRRGPIVPDQPLKIANALRDASPDYWGRRVIAYRLGGGQRSAYDMVELDELTFMLQSGSDRIGALDFQASPRDYVPRVANNETLESLLGSAERLEQGLTLAPGLAEALQHGSTIGGAMPKVLIQDEKTKYIAKFSSSNESFSVVKAEFIAMRLARIAGLNVAAVRLVRVLNKDVLLIERFDRVPAEDGWMRRAMVSGLTLLGLDELFAAHASYEALADIIRARFTTPTETLVELFSRITLNILVGNTDDHARNHAAFWDGQSFTLTPAYDVCPQSRIGREASQGMQIHGPERRSQLALCLATANKFLLSDERALAIIKNQVAVIAKNWDKVCNEAGLDDADKRLLWRRQFLNDFAFEGLETRLATSIELRDRSGHTTSTPSNF